MDKNGIEKAFEVWARQTGVVRSDSYREDSLRLFDGLRRRLERIDDALVEDFGPAVRFDASGSPDTHRWEDA